jgi:hypothetical protein
MTFSRRLFLVIVFKFLDLLLDVIPHVAMESEGELAEGAG